MALSTTIYCEQVDACLVSNDTTYAAARTAANADTIRGQAVTQYAGQAKEGASGFDVYRTALLYDPSSLKGASITSALIRLYEPASTAINDAQNLVMVSGADVADTGVTVSRFGALLDDTTEWGSIASSSWVSGDNDIDLNAAAITALEAAISGGTLFKIALRGQHDIDNTADGGFIERNRFDFAGPTEGISGRRPRLIVIYKSSLPADDISRVTGIRHVYKPGFFRMVLSLGDVSNTIEIAERKVRKELEIPEQQTPPPEPYPFAPERPVPPTYPRTGIIPPEPVTPEPTIPRIFPTTPGVVMPEETFRKIFPEARPSAVPSTFGEILGATVRAAIPSPIRKVWRTITPWKEEAGETFGGEVAERFRSIRRFFGGS